MNHKEVLVVMLTANKPSRIKLIPIGEYKEGNQYTTQEELMLVDEPTEFGYPSVFVYFLSDDPIQENDWCVNTNYDTLYQLTNITASRAGVEFWRKVIATTNPELDIVKYTEGGNVINGGQPVLLPQPSSEFIEKFVSEYNAGRPVTKCLVEVNSYDDYKGKDTPEGIYFGSIKVADDNTINILPSVKESFSREEVINLLKKFYNEQPDISNIGLPTLQKWFNNWIKENL